MSDPKLNGETDHCRERLLKYCQGQGLDLGCGMTKIKPDAIGIDLYNPMADMNRKAQVLDYYRDEQFDYVYSSHLLEEIQDTEPTLKEWVRVLKKGGYLILYQADKDYYYPLGHQLCNHQHKHHFYWEDLWKILESFGNMELVHHQRYDPGMKEWSFELVARKKPEHSLDLTFKIMIVGGPAEKYIDRCLQSLIQQDYPNWKAQVILDPVGDKTYERACSIKDPRIAVKLNETRQYAVANLLEASKLLAPSDDEVLMMLDADDWLYGPKSLSIVQGYYDRDPELLLTHGSWTSVPDPNVINNNLAYTPYEFEVGIRRSRWKGSHLRTFKYKLWKNIKDEDLRDENGQYMKTAWDLFLMFPMLEMAGYSRVKFIPEILYVYNQETPYNDHKQDHAGQMKYTNYVRNKKPYEYRKEL